MKKQLMLLCVSIIFLLSIVSNSFAWTLVYANDASGTATYGNIQTLIDAVKDGKQVRVLKDEIWIADATHLQINNNVVTAQSEGIGLTLSGNNVVVTTPPYREYRILSTDGKYQNSGFYIATGAQHHYDNMSASMKWFVQ